MTPRLLLAAAMIAGAAPAVGVGLGPLSADGLTASDRKGFYLTLMNTDPRRAEFHLYAVGWADEEAQPRIVLPAAVMSLPGTTQRRVLVVASGLSAGEVYRFRVCAEQADFGEGAMIHARVCSKLVARRIG